MLCPALTEQMAKHFDIDTWVSPVTYRRYPSPLHLAPYTLHPNPQFGSLTGRLKNSCKNWHKPILDLMSG